MRKLLALMLGSCAFLFFIGNVFHLGTRLILFMCIILGLILLMGFWYLRKVWFYRDPKREAPDEKKIVVSPADGRLMYIKELKNNKVICNKIGENIEIDELIHNKNISIKEGWLIGIYMTPFDIHYNYAPFSGVIQEINYVKTNLNLPMVDLWEYINFTLLRRAVDLFNRKFHFINERMTISIKGEYFTVHVILIADKFVNKIKKYVEKGSSVNISQKIAFIERGSQVDLVIPKKDIHIVTKVGKQVYGGKSILARY